MQIHFRDNGIAIEAENLIRIFEPFEQCARSVQSGYGGLGLGLAISKGLVEALGGRLLAKSSGPGTGSTFEVTLTTLPSPQRTSPLMPELHPPQLLQLPLRILLIEDHTDTREILTRMLQRSGFLVESVADISSALAQAARARFDLYLSDLGLPDGSGLELLPKLLAIQPLPAISLSGFGMELDIQQSHAAGFSEHLVKPIDFPQLRAAIVRVLNSNHPAF